LHYKWSKEFLEAGKQRLAGNTQRQATSEEVQELRKELDQLTCAYGPVQASCWWGLSLEEPRPEKRLAGIGGRNAERMIRRTPEEKMEISHLVEHSDLSIAKTCAELDVARSTFYRWYSRYQEEGFEGLMDRQSKPQQFWNRILAPVKDQIVALALAYPDQESE
jgi:transposase-like protein